MNGVIAAAATSVGNVREHNEDSHLIDDQAGVFAVADGMGGHAAGEVASALAVRIARQHWTSTGAKQAALSFAEHAEPEARRQLLQSIRAGVLEAHLAIVDQGREDPSKKGMGTTFTGFAIAGGHAVFAHAGDSRAYLIRDESAIQLTEDHTVVARLRAAGVGESDRRDPSRWHGVLTNALGVGDGSRIATFVLPLYHGDRFLLCTDGIHDYVQEAEVGEAVSGAPSPALAAQRLVDLALERGGADNATAVAVRILEAAEAHVPSARRARDEAILAASGLLGQLSERERLRALRITTPREYRAGDAIAPIALGDRVAYLVLDGEVELAGGAAKRAGDLVFPQALVDGAAPTEPARAATPVSLLVIRRHDFLELTEDDGDLGVKLYAALAAILRQG